MDHAVRIGRVAKALEYSQHLNSALLIMGPPKANPDTLRSWGYYRLRETSKRTVARLADELEYLQARHIPNDTEHDDDADKVAIDSQGDA